MNRKYGKVLVRKQSPNQTITLPKVNSFLVKLSAVSLKLSVDVNVESSVMRISKVNSFMNALKK